MAPVFFLTNNSVNAATAVWRFFAETASSQRATGPPDELDVLEVDELELELELLLDELELDVELVLDVLVLDEVLELDELEPLFGPPQAAKTPAVININDNERIFIL
jgi:hypothetical protein